MKLNLLLSFLLIISSQLFPSTPPMPILGQNDKKNDQVKSQKIDFENYQIHIEVMGQGKPIFFFAGGPGNSHDYMEENFKVFSDKYQLIFIDMLGRGLSDDAEDPIEYSIQNDVAVTESIRKALKLDKISLCGHSYGTVVAQAYAIQHPENVDKMVLISGFHSGEMWQANCDSYNHYSKTHFPEKWNIIDSLRNLGYVSSDPLFSEIYGNLPIKYIYYHDTSIKQKSPDKKFRGWNSEVYYGIIGRDADFFVSGSMMDTDFRKDLNKLNCPTLIIAGRYDGVSTPEYNVQYKTFMPNAQFEMFEKSGHNPYLEEEEKFYNMLRTFLAS